jgi:hypothetical protein
MFTGGPVVKFKAAFGFVMALVAIAFLTPGMVSGAGIRVVPSADRVTPGEILTIDIVAEGIPSEGLGSVQFRLKVQAPGTTVASLADLGQALPDRVTVAAPLLMSAPTATRSGLGPFFLNGQGPSGILALDNETISQGAALFTFGHTREAVRSSGNESVARFKVKVGEMVGSDEIAFSLADVLLLDGGPEYPLDYNIGAVVRLRCLTQVPDLTGKSLDQARQTLAASGLTLGSVYEVPNASGTKALGVVLEQSVAVGTQTLCDSTVDLAINTPPADVTGLAWNDKADDDRGTIQLSWSPSVSADIGGYRVTKGSALLREISNPQGNGTEISGLANGAAHTLTVKAFDASGNQSAGTSVTVTPLDDVFPVVTIAGVSEGAFYNTPVTVQISATDNQMDRQSATLNGDSFDFAPIDRDGSYTLVVTAIDSSNNRTEKSVSFTVDQSVPAISVSNIADGGQYRTNLVPAIDIVDGNLEPAATVITLDGEPYQAGAAVIGEGPHLLVIFARDRATNGASLTLNFTLDKTPPVITVGGVADGAFYKEEVTPVVSVGDLYLSASSILLDGEPFPPGSVLSVEKSYELVVTAEDEAGNRAERTLRFAIDKTSPAITVGGLIDGGFYREDVAPTLEVSDAHLKASSILLDGVPFIPGSVLTAEKSYELVITGEDEAGNSASRTIHFVIDKTLPEIVVEGVDDGELYIRGVTPTVTITDAYLKASQLTLNAELFVSGTEISAEGSYQLEVRGEDQAGNVAERFLGFIVDLTPPTSASSLGDPRFADAERLYVAAGTPIALTATDGGVVPTGVAGISYALDWEEAWTVFSHPFTLVALSEGSHQIHFRARDGAGNEESAHTLDLVLDKSAPVTTHVLDGSRYSGEDGKLYVSGTTELSLATTDNLSGVARTEYRLGDGAWGDFEPFFPGVLGEGVHVLHFRSVDRVANLEAERTLAVTVDATAPVTTLTTGTPQHIGADGILYVTGATHFTLEATEALSGVSLTEYRMGEGPWTTYGAPFTLAGLPAGAQTLVYRSADQVGNVEGEKSLTVVVDNEAPVTTLTTGTPQHTSADGILYVTGSTGFSLATTEPLSGVARVDIRIDGGDWGVYGGLFQLQPEGEHRIEYRSTDLLGNREEIQVLLATVDNAPPQTSIRFEGQSFLDGEKILVSPVTTIVLEAADSLSGVGVTGYRFDEEIAWRTYHGSFPLAGLSPGSHAIFFRSVDHLGLAEAEQVVGVTLLSVEAEVEILNLPRILVWTEDPGAPGNNKTPYTLSQVHSLLEQALGGPDLFFTLVTDKEVFRQEFRSGLYNMIMVLNQDVPFDTVFLREMKEAVRGGMGLLVSSWGNSVPPLWQDVFGVDFKGSLPLNEAERAVQLFNSSVSEAQTLAASGRVLKAPLDGGVLAGILPAESTCGGVRTLTLIYPADLRVGDRVTATLSVPQGNKLTLVDEEQVTLTALPAGPFNAFTGQAEGDLLIGEATTQGLLLSLTAPFGVLGENYSLELSIEHQDGRLSRSGEIAINPTCAANLRPGMHIGPFPLAAIDEDRVRTGEDLPAVVLNRYGKGRTVFVSYNVLDSEFITGEAGHRELLRGAAAYLLPEDAGLRPGGVVLLETRLSLAGGNLNVKCVEHLGASLTHLPVFSLTASPLEFDLRSEEGGEISYRYFVRAADQAGTYEKETEVLLGMSGGYTLFDRYATGWALENDSHSLLRQAQAWVEQAIRLHPEAAAGLSGVTDTLVGIACMPRTTSGEIDKLIHQMVQIIHRAEQLPIDASGLQMLLGDCLRIVEGEGYFN